MSIPETWSVNIVAQQERVVACPGCGKKRLVPFYPGGRWEGRCSGCLGWLKVTRKLEWEDDNDEA